jgi:hypothetical protein
MGQTRQIKLLKIHFAAPRKKTPAADYRSTRPFTARVRTVPAKSQSSSAEEGYKIAPQRAAIGSIPAAVFARRLPISEKMSSEISALENGGKTHG